MLSWNQTKKQTGSPSNSLDDTASIPDGTFPVGSLSVVADDQGVYLVLNLRGTTPYLPTRQLSILLAERQQAKDSREAVEQCKHSLLVKFGLDTAEKVIGFLFKEYGPNWALKYLPLDDHVFDLYDEARLALLVLASEQGGDTW